MKYWLEVSDQNSQIRQLIVFNSFLKLRSLEINYMVLNVVDMKLMTNVN